MLMFCTTYVYVCYVLHVSSSSNSNSNSSSLLSICPAELHSQ